LYTELQGYAQGLEGMVEARTADLQEAQAQLIQAEKLASVGTLAAGIAHEVNNPLQAIALDLESAIEDVEAKLPEVYDALVRTQSSVDRITRIVKGLLAFARPTKPELEAVDLNQAVKEMLTLARRELEDKRVSVRTDLKASQVVKGSADQLMQVFLNLVLNARDAMPNGGKLTVSTYDEDGFVALCVRDTGMGIEPDAISQLFDPFYTTKASGTGLGLAVSYGIIQSHEGRIEVQSEPGKGTEFIVQLPVMENG
jgi:two-component system, NtrC family, sensor kinase